MCNRLGILCLSAWRNEGTREWNEKCFMQFQLDLLNCCTGCLVTVILFHTSAQTLVYKTPTIFPLFFFCFSPCLLSASSKQKNSGAASFSDEKLALSPSTRSDQQNLSGCREDHTLPTGMRGSIGAKSDRQAEGLFPLNRSGLV